MAQACSAPRRDQDRGADPLLERGEELAALESVVEAPRGGRGQLVLVAGEAGIGKTSLVRALRGRLEGRAASRTPGSSSSSPIATTTWP